MLLTSFLISMACIVTTDNDNEMLEIGYFPFPGLQGIISIQKISRRDKC